MFRVRSNRRNGVSRNVLLLIITRVLHLASPGGYYYRTTLFPRGPSILPDAWTPSRSVITTSPSERFSVRMTNLQIHKTYTIASAVNLEAEFESRGSYAGGPRFNSQMNHFFQMLNFGHVTAGRVRRLLTNERRHGAIAVSSVEVPYKLRDIFVNRSGGF